MDNRVFNINGRTKEQLLLAVQLLLLNEYGEKQKVKGWYYSQKKGLILTWLVDNKYRATAFTDRMGKPSEIGEKELVDLLWDWLSTDEAKEVVCENWDADTDHDGDNVKGWRLYTDEWGCIKETEHTLDHYSIAAFKPAWLWYGK